MFAAIYVIVNFGSQKSFVSKFLVSFSKAQYGMQEESGFKVTSKCTEYFWVSFPLHGIELSAKYVESVMKLDKIFFFLKSSLFPKSKERKANNLIIHNSKLKGALIWCSQLKSKIWILVVC